MINVHLVDSNGSIVRTCEWLTQEGAEHQAKTWSEIFPKNIICINNSIFYDGRKQK